MKTHAQPGIVLAFTIAALVFCRRGSAQDIPLSRPAISPYLNLYRTDSGVVDNYNAYVRPRLELHSLLERQQRILRRQSANIFSLQRNAWGPAGRGEQAVGSASIFMNYSHYFPSPQSHVAPRAVRRR